MSKRAFSEEGDRGQEGSAKRRAHGPGPAVFYRVLCPTQRIGNVIGKGGDVIQQLRTDTGARIKVEPQVAGCAERVIAILAPDRPEERWCDAQQALFRVHERISCDRDPDTALESALVRLLVDQTQVGCILGKGGSIISELRRATGSSIRVLSKQEIPACAAPNDEVLQVSGDAARVLDALQQASERLRETPSRQPIQLSRTPQPGRHIAITASASAHGPGAAAAPRFRDGPTSAAPAQGGRAERDAPAAPPPPVRETLPPHLLAAPGPGAADAAAPGRRSVDVDFRVLVPDVLVGSVIGRGGDVVRRIRAETGARIKVFEGGRAGGGGDRVVAVGSPDDGTAPTCAAQEALQRVAMCLLEAGSAPPAPSVLRLLVPAAQGAAREQRAAAAQARALGGRDGDRLAAAAREAGAALRLGALPPRERPAAAAPGDELAALEGAPAAVAAALRLLGQALRRWQARAAGGAAPPPQPRGGSPASARGSPAPGHEGLARRASGPAQIVLPPSRALPRSQLAGRDGAVMAAATATLVLSAAQAGCILGRGGSNITQIRQVSGAYVRLGESLPGVTERVLEMNGALEQVQSAQSLVQAFLLANGAPPVGLLGRPV